MNYELAKELKDAGFPQNPAGYGERPDSWYHPNGALFDYFPLDGASYVPTLSELIEALGDHFLSLDRVREDWWRVTGYKNGVINWVKATPEEAVAHLWLALNQHRVGKDKA